MKSENFLERFQIAMQYRGVKPADVANATGISKSSISEYLSGKNVPKQDNVYKIAKYLCVDFAWLIGANTDMFGNVNNDSQFITLPIYGKIPAGMPIEAVENIIETIKVPLEMLNFKGDVVALRISGDSMEPKFIENDIVLIQITSDCESGQICAVYINGYDVTLKKVIKQDKGILLLPSNPKYQPRFYPYDGEESVTIYGLAKGIIRMM